MKEFINKLLNDVEDWRLQSFIDKMKDFKGQCTTNQQEEFIRGGLFAALAIQEKRVARAKNPPAVSDVAMSREGRDIKFEVAFAITQDEAIELQGQLTYPAAGYGFYKFESTPNKTTWECSNSSD